MGWGEGGNYDTGARRGQYCLYITSRSPCPCKPGIICDGDGMLGTFQIVGISREACQWTSAVGLFDGAKYCTGKPRPSGPVRGAPFACHDQGSSLVGQPGRRGWVTLPDSTEQYTARSAVPWHEHPSPTAAGGVSPAMEGGMFWSPVGSSDAPHHTPSGDRSGARYIVLMDAWRLCT